MELAYRFFDNQQVTPQKILQPHINATLERISQCKRVVLVQDTTELDLTRPSQQVQGAGPMDSNARRRAFVHLLAAFDSGGLPLGTVWQKTWARKKMRHPRRTQRGSASVNRHRSRTRRACAGSRGSELLAMLRQSVQTRRAFVSATVNRIFTKCSANRDRTAAMVRYQKFTFLSAPVRHD